jgi:putative heme iron utilization protein
MEKSSSPYLFISRNDSSIADGNDLGGIHFGGTEDGSAYDKDSAVINAEAAGTWDVGGTDTPSRLRFYTTPAGSSVAVERLRITKDGLVSGSGTFHNVGAATLGSTLAVSGNVGIGIASPAGLLHLEDSANPYIYLTRNDSSIVDGETLGGFLFGGTENGADYDTNSAVIQAKAAGTWDVGGADTPARLIFKTTPAGSSTNATRLSIMEDGLVSGSGTFHNVGASTFGSTIVASGSITAGSSFIIGSADLNETDMEKLDGITNGTATAAKAVVLDASKNIATIGTIGCGAITSTGTSTFTAAEIGGGYGDTGTTLYGNGNIKADGNLIVSGTLHQVGAATFAGAVATTGAISGSSTLHAVGASTFGSTIAASSSITAGSSFIIGSADLNETDLEKLDGITNGTATAAKAVVLDASKNIATIGTVGCGAITSTGTSTFAAAEIGGGYGSTGITLYGNGNLKADGDLVVGGAISGSSVVRLGSSLSASGDVAVTGAIHAANFYGDGSGLTNLSTATSLSGTTAQLTTGVETSGYLKVSGSTTLDGNLVIDGVISASSLVRLGASLSASRDIAVTGAVHAEYYYGDGSNLTNISAATATALSGTTAQLTTGVETSGYLKVSGSTTLDGLTKAAAYSGSGFLQAVGATILGSTLNVSGTTTLAGTTNAQAVTYTTISGSSTLQTVGATTLGSTLNVSGAILGADNIGTTGGFLTASAQLKGLSLVLEGQTAIDKNRNATLNAFSGSGTLQAVGATTFGSTMEVSGTTTLGNHLIVDGVISGSSILRLGTSISASGDVAATGSMHAEYYYGDGSNLTNISAGTATALSGTTAQLTTGVETSGYLKVSGSTTLAGGVVHARVHKTGHYTVADSDYYIGVDSSGGAVTLTLPAAATFSNGQTWVIKDEAGAANSNNIKITASAGTNTIDGQNYILLESPYASVQLYCNGAAKYFIQ